MNDNPETSNLIHAAERFARQNILNVDDLRESIKGIICCRCTGASCRDNQARRAKCEKELYILINKLLEGLKKKGEE